MTVSKGAKIFAAVITTIILIELLVVIILLATHGHDDDTGIYAVKEEFVQTLKITLKAGSDRKKQKSFRSLRLRKSLVSGPIPKLSFIIGKT